MSSVERGAHAQSDTTNTMTEMSVTIDQVPINTNDVQQTLAQTK